MDVCILLSFLWYSVLFLWTAFFLYSRRYLQTLFQPNGNRVKKFDFQLKCVAFRRSFPSPRYQRGAQLTLARATPSKALTTPRKMSEVRLMGSRSLISTHSDNCNRCQFALRRGLFADTVVVCAVARRGDPPTDANATIPRDSYKDSP